LQYEVHARVLTQGGKITGGDGALTVEGADEATVLLTCATSFVLDYDKCYTGGDLSLAGKRMDTAAAKSYDKLRAAVPASQSPLATVGHVR